jgi:predicted ribonuclease YlaK
MNTIINEELARRSHEQKGDRDVLEKVLNIYNSESEEGLYLVSKNEKQRVHVSPSYFRWENEENNHILEIEDGDIETISYYVSNTEWEVE